MNCFIFTVTIASDNSISSCRRSRRYSVSSICTGIVVAVVVVVVVVVMIGK
jgi:t-SNARE complex subunit (syntaxin)